MSRWTEERFTKVMSPYLPALYRLAYRLTSRRGDAEDLLQDVLTKLFERSAELSSIRDLEPYIRRVLYNHFVDDRRRYGRQPLRLVSGGGIPETLASPDDPAADAEAAETRRRLSRALDRLSEDHRIVVVLADVEGHSLPEIEALTDVPIGTLKSRLSRARARLRELLEADGTFFVDRACSSTDGAKRDAV
jgi:RNA polymerase sigma-70 factor (ECF subfamily)